MKLWDKNIETDQLIEQFTIGKDRELDVLLAPYDVLGSIAHILMLENIGLLEKSETLQLQNALREIFISIEKGEFVIEDGMEDVHSEVEFLLTRRLGDAGKKIHSARSRNDQVLLDLKLFTRDAIEQIAGNTRKLFDLLQEKSETYKHILMPGYTHMQVAMPSSFGLWFGAYAENLTDDMQLLLAAYRITDQNPLGSAAGYGSSFPVKRQMTTDLLGFASMNYNVVHAQMSRGKTEKIVSFALSALAGTIARMAADICLFNSQNFGFIRLPDNLTTGSSIMPHKKNPDVFELIRAKCNKIQSLPSEIDHITGNLTSGYFRDMQIIKESFLPVFNELNDILNIATYAVSKILPNEDILKDNRYNYLFSVEEVNELVLKGMPFREAYKAVARKIQDGTYSPVQSVNHSHEGSIGNLCTRQIADKMNLITEKFDFERKESAYRQLLGR